MHLADLPTCAALPRCDGPRAPRASVPSTFSPRSMPRPPTSPFRAIAPTCIGVGCFANGARTPSPDEPRCVTKRCAFAETYEWPARWCGLPLLLYACSIAACQPATVYVPGGNHHIDTLGSALHGLSFQIHRFPASMFRAFQHLSQGFLPYESPRYAQMQPVDSFGLQRSKVSWLRRRRSRRVSREVWRDGCKRSPGSMGLLCGSPRRPLGSVAPSAVCVRVAEIQPKSRRCQVHGERAEDAAALCKSCHLRISTSAIDGPGARCCGLLLCDRPMRHEGLERAAVRQLRGVRGQRLWRRHGCGDNSGIPSSLSLWRIHPASHSLVGPEAMDNEASALRSGVRRPSGRLPQQFAPS